MVNSEGKDYFEINEFTGEIFTKVVFDREKQAAYALAIEARDSAPSARPNSNGQPNTGKKLKFCALDHMYVESSECLVFLSSVCMTS